MRNDAHRWPNQSDTEGISCQKKQRKDKTASCFKPSLVLLVLCAVSKLTCQLHSNRKVQPGKGLANIYCHSQNQTKNDQRESANQQNSLFLSFWGSVPPFPSTAGLTSTCLQPVFQTVFIPYLPAGQCICHLEFPITYNSAIFKFLLLAYVC